MWRRNLCLHQGKTDQHIHWPVNIISIVGLGAWLSPFRGFGSTDQHSGNRIIHEQQVSIHESPINTLILIIWISSCEIHTILHGGDINPNSVVLRMMGIKEVTWILRLEALDMHCCQCRYPLGSDFWGQLFDMEGLLQMLAAATCHEISHMLARIVEIRRFEGCILIHEADIHHVFDMGVALNEVVQHFLLFNKPSVVIEWYSFIQSLNMPIIIVAIKDTSKTHATLWIEKGMFPGVCCSKKAIDACRWCSRSIPIISLVLLPCTAVLVSCSFLCSAVLAVSSPPLLWCEIGLDTAGCTPSWEATMGVRLFSFILFVMIYSSNAKVLRAASSL